MDQTKNPTIPITCYMNRKWNGEIVGKKLTQTVKNTSQCQKT